MLTETLYSGGVPTDYNQSGGDSVTTEAETEYAQTLKALKDAIAGLDELCAENSDDLTNAQSYYKQLEVLARRVLTAGTLTAGDYTAQSWSDFQEAASAAATFLGTHRTAPTDPIGKKEAAAYYSAFAALWDAGYKGLVPARAGTATLHIVDSYAARKGTEPHEKAGTYTVNVPAGGVTIHAALQQIMGENYALPFDNKGLGYGVYVNGVYVFNSTSVLTNPASSDYRDVRLKDGDSVVVALMDMPTFTNLSGSLTFHMYRDIHEALRYTHILQNNVPAEEVSAAAGAAISLKAVYSYASLMDFSGTDELLGGAKVYVSAACATRAEALKAAATEDTGVVTGSDGGFTVSLPSAQGSTEGWYALNLLATDENGGLANGPSLIVHVTDPDDLSGLKAELTAALEATYTAYEDDFYSAAQLESIRTLHDDGVSGIAAATNSGDAEAAFRTANDGIAAIQRENEAALDVNLAAVRNLMEQLPTAADLAAGKLYDFDKTFLDLLFAADGWYTRMTAYQKGCLTGDETALLADLRAAWADSDNGASLPEIPAFTVRVETRDADTGALLDLTVSNSTPSTTMTASGISVDPDTGGLTFSGLNTLNLPIDNAVYTLPTGGWYLVRLSPVVAAADRGDYTQLSGAEGFTTDIDSHYRVDKENENANLGLFYTIRKNATITLYFRATDPVSAAKTVALAELETAYQKYDRTSYTEENWTKLVAAYNQGKSTINGAVTVIDVGTEKGKALDALEGIPIRAAGDFGTAYVTVRNDTYPMSSGAPWDGALVENEPIALTADSTMMSCIVDALGKYNYTVEGAENNYISSIQGIAAFDGGNQSGWMGTLNDWFTNEGFGNFTVANGKLHDRDVISIEYTCAFGLDIRGGIETNHDTSLYDLALTNGTLSPAFDPTVTDYVFTLDSGASTSTVTFTNNNRSFQSRGYLNSYAPTAVNYIRSGDTVTVAGGDVLYVGVGEGAWPAMGTGMPTKYAVSIVSPDDAKGAEKLIAAIGSVTYTNYKDKQAVVNKAKVAYNALSDVARGQVGNIDKLTAAEAAIEGFEAVDAFKTELAAFPSDMTQPSKAQLQALVDDYEALKDNKNLLTVAEKAKYDRARAALNGIIQGETDAEKLVADKTAIEAAAWTVDQATANDAVTLKTFVEGKLAAMTLNGTPAVTVGSVTPAVAGSADKASGTDGKYSFTVALTLNQSTDTVAVTDAAITATAYVAPAPTLTYTAALESVQAYVKAAVPNPIVGSTKGEWAVFALNRGGAADADWNAKYLAALQTYVAENDGVLHEKKYTEYSRVVIALTSMGVDATQFQAGEKTYDLVSPLLDKQDSGAYWAEWQGNNGTAFALLAVDSHNYLDNADGKALRAGLIASIKANQLESGAWSISGESADLDVTAAAIYALAPYLNAARASAVGVSVSDVQTMVNNALAYLSDRQNETGGYGSAEADGWVVIALSTLGRDADTDEAFVKNGRSVLADLLSYFDETSGGFKHLTSGSVDQMASEQAAYDLAAYDRYKTGKTALYDMSDVEIKPNAPGPVDEADKAAAAAVDAKIDAIGTVTLESETAITAARAAYDALTDAQKALVTKYATLATAEAKLTALKNKDNKPDKDKDQTITVTMRLIGAEKATKDVDLSKDSYLPNYVTWIPTTSYTLEKGSTVYDLWTTATAAYSIRSVGAENNYVETVYAPSGYALSEFTNGPRSGWMYTINGRHPGFGLCEQELYDGDVVIWHYVNDYSYEVEDWFKDDPNYPALGDGTYWNLWLKAPDSTGGSGGGVAGGEKKDEKKDGASGGGTTSDSNTITADDGSTVTVETEKSVETKENEDGSVTETVTETTKTTVVAPDGSTSVTETVVESETTTNSVKKADGSVTETEQTVEKVTETVTGPDGKKQTTVTETEETKQLNTTTGADGKVSGTGTYSAKSTVTVDGKATTAVTEGAVAVSTDDKGTVSEVTTAKTVTTAPDGTKTETVTVITEAEMTNGTTGKVVADGEGNTISAEASVSQAALEAAVKSGEPIEIPVTVNAASGATVRISLEGATGDGKAWVEIGTTDTAPGNVAYLKLADGVTKLLTTCKTGSVIVPVEGSCEVIVKDNSKSFSDVDGASWYGDSVTFVTARSIFNGNGDGTFAPTATMNRAMAAQILYNLDGSAKAGDGTSFSDVSADDWFNGAVGWASGLGVITGYNGAYAPLDAVTRQDLVTILYRYAKAAGYDVSAGRTVDLTAYADGAEVADYAAEAMRWAIAVGLVKGYEDNTLRPTATATRAEVAAIMQRMVQNAVK